MLRLDRVRKSFDGRRIIESVSLHAAAGELLCLSGPSGVGKSTLLELMAGVIAPDGGSVIRNGAVALAFQDDALIPWLDAAANIAYALPSPLPAGEGEARVRFWLERFGLDAALFPAAMSGGMRRRLNMARAFAVARPLLLLDEPFAFLDAEWQERVARFARERVEQGDCLVLTSHTLEPLQPLPYRRLNIHAAPVRIEA